jgi:lipopolysaccharide biosynthesis protein
MAKLCYSGFQIVSDFAVDLLAQLTANTSAGSEYEAYDETVRAPAVSPVRLIAFYLPQFHSIAENDLWWGKGFTEWTNVTKAVPRFAGHYQPRLPGALGFYDATKPETLSRQAALAKQYGIGGFCFHHYWFGGRRILEKPIDTLLAHPEIDLPFCVNWANENWTRRWDGKDADILLQQAYSPEDDIAFARSLEPLFRDRRYIRINGRPLLLLYRPDLLPDAGATVARWRDHFISAGLGDPFIAAVQTLGSNEASCYGMDAGVGFPPFWTCYDIPMRSDLVLFDRKFTGAVRDYSALADASITACRRDRRVFPGVTPSWDNESRRPGRGMCFSGSTPSAYGRWLSAACRISMHVFSGDEKLVFINAWNEWAEGAHLEPDRKFGHAYLAETCRVINSLSSEQGGEAFPDQIKASAEPLQTPVRRARRLARRSLNLAADVMEKIAWTLRGK